MTDHTEPSLPIPFSRPFAWDRVQPKGTTVTLDATEAECAAIAEALDILTVARVHAEFTLTPWRRTGYKLVGTVEAEVEQACVVTLDPVAERIREVVELTFLPPEEIEAVSDEVEVLLDVEDPSEPIEGSTIDLGIFATEFVAVGLDPYPRLPGVEFEPFIEDDGSNDAPASPFAALSTLKDK
ncbi:YceD family protein [Oryzibacter oryziterrae]|uniref:YceD family protein n=1 Tax=Oryzibacter oryziterrae TaxID=2766474 RepID=UPI001F295A41|nr:DUF177 domain-containing protein [Oryzibacter oryziterrae]